MSSIVLFTYLHSTKSVAEWGLGTRLSSALCSLQCVPSPQLCVCVTVMCPPLSLVPQPQQYKVELEQYKVKLAKNMAKRRKGTKEVCDCNSVSLITTQ